MKKIFYTLGFLAISAFSVNAQNVTTYMGTGQTGSNQSGAARQQAVLNAPYGIAKDSKGTIYITEEQGHLISIISDDKYYQRAGSLAGGFKDGTGASNALVAYPRGIAIGSDDAVYIVDGGNHAIRKLAPFTNVGNAQAMTTIAGGKSHNAPGVPGYAEGTGMSALFDDPRGIAIDPTNGDLIVADYGNMVIRRVNPNTGVTSLVAGRPGGNSVSENGGALTQAQFASPIGVHVDDNGDIYVVQENNSDIKKISNGQVTTVTSTRGFDRGNSLLKIGNEMYISVGCGLQKVTGSSSAYYAGDDSRCSFLDGSGTTARFNETRGILLLNETNLLVADQENNRIRQVSITEGQDTTGGGDTTVSIRGNRVANQGFIIYPNPAQSFVMIERKSAAQQEATVLTIFDIAGREIVRENISASVSSHRLSLENFQKGVYIIRLQSGMDISTSKLIVNK